MRGVIAHSATRRVISKPRAAECKAQSTEPIIRRGKPHFSRPCLRARRGAPAVPNRKLAPPRGAFARTTSEHGSSADRSRGVGRGRLWVRAVFRVAGVDSYGLSIRWRVGHRLSNRDKGVFCICCLWSIVCVHSEFVSKAFEAAPTTGFRCEPGVFPAQCTRYARGDTKGNQGGGDH